MENSAASGQHVNIQAFCHENEPSNKQDSSGGVKLRGGWGGWGGGGDPTENGDGS